MLPLKSSFSRGNMFLFSVLLCVTCGIIYLQPLFHNKIFYPLFFDLDSITSLEDITQGRNGLIQKAKFFENLKISLGFYADIEMEDVVIPSLFDETEQYARLYRPRERQGSLPIIIHYHGGAYFWLGNDTHQDLCVSMVREVHAIVLLPDFRLAPEYRYPAALHDGYSAYIWARQHASEYGGNRDRIFLSGDSSGGNLAASLSLLLRDRGEPMPKAQLLFYPMLAGNKAPETYSSWETLGQCCGIHNHTCVRMWDVYLPQPTPDPVPVYSAPLLAESFAGLPPTLVLVAEFDLLKDEGYDYVKKLKAAGGEGEVKLHEQSPHGFMTPGFLFPSDHTKGIRECAEFISKV